MNWTCESPFCFISFRRNCTEIFSLNSQDLQLPKSIRRTSVRPKPTHTSSRTQARLIRAILFTDPRRAHHRRRATRVIEKVCAQSGTSTSLLPSSPSFLPQSPHPPRPILIHPGNIRSHNRIASRSRRTARIPWPVLARAHSRDPSFYRLIPRIITFWRTVIPQSLVRRARPCPLGFRVDWSGRNSCSRYVYTYTLRRRKGTGILYEFYTWLMDCGKRHFMR